MRSSATSLQAICVSEHYWPGLADELVLAQCQRLGHLDRLLAAVVLPGQQTAFGLFLGSGPDDVRQAVASVAMTASQVNPAWLLASASRALVI